MKVRICAKGSNKAGGLKIKGVKAGSMVVAASLVVAGIGIGLTNKLWDDTSATSEEVINISEHMVANPAYEEYLADVAAGKADNWELIPSQYVLKHDGERSRMRGADGESQSLPAKFNLRDEGYATKIKNQGTDGICWAYATTTAIESYLLKNDGINIELSPKQMDYLYAGETPQATYVKDLIDIERQLGDGGNFLIAATGFHSGLTPVKEDAFFSIMQQNDAGLANYDSWLDYENWQSIGSFLTTGESEAYAKELDYQDVTSSDSDYVVAEFTNYELDDSSISAIKRNIYENGAAYVGTVAPGVESCYDEDTKTIIDKGSIICGANNGHAMAVVGWDDNHTYTVKSGDEITTKTGAFILQNSWGKSSLLEDYGIDYDYLVEHGIINPEDMTAEQIQSLKDLLANYDADETVYLAYEGLSSFLAMTDFGLISKIVPNEYDSIYSVTMGENYKGLAEGDGNEVIFTYSTGSKKEKIDSIAIAAYAVGLQSDIAYEVMVDSGEGFRQVGTVTQPGGSIGMQRMLNLANPIDVKGTFKIKIATISGGQKVSVAGVVDNFAATIYMNDNAGSDAPVNPGDAEDPTEVVEPDNQDDLPGAGAITWENGSNVYDLDSGDVFALRIDYPLESFEVMMIDNKIVADENYDLESGSTIITLHNDYLDSLETGKHTIVAMFANDVMVTTDFYVINSEVPVPNTASDGNTAKEAGTPNTGRSTESMDGVDVAGGMALGAVGLVVVVLYMVVHNKNRVKFD